MESAGVHRTLRCTGWKEEVEMQEGMFCRQSVGSGYLIIRICFVLSSYIYDNSNNVSKEISFSVGKCPLSYRLNLPPALCLDEFHFWDSRRCFSRDFEPRCRRGQAIMQRAKHLAFITPISFFFFFFVVRWKWDVVSDDVLIWCRWWQSRWWWWWWQSCCGSS